MLQSYDGEETAPKDLAQKVLKTVLNCYYLDTYTDDCVEELSNATRIEKALVKRAVKDLYDKAWKLTD